MNNYEYFSGANVIVSYNDSEMIECAGLSYVVQTSDQPIYGYASTQFDLILNGREIIQGNFLINMKKTNFLDSKKGKDNNIKRTITDRFGSYFDITVNFSNSSRTETLKDCRLLSRGTTIQISEQVLLEEYSFVARFIEYS